MASVTYMAWPEHVRMSYHVSRIIGLCDFGAADFTEIYQAVLRIDPTDDSSWNREWLRMAELVEEMATEAEAHNNHSSARFAYQRASNYYRLAQDVLHPDDPCLFPGRNGTRISRVGVWKLIKKHAKNAGIKRNFKGAHKQP